jgi:hypothetical protein
MVIVPTRWDRLTAGAQQEHMATPPCLVAASVPFQVCGQRRKSIWEDITNCNFPFSISVAI